MTVTVLHTHIEIRHTGGHLSTLVVVLVLRPDQVVKSLVGERRGGEVGGIGTFLGRSGSRQEVEMVKQ